MKRLTLPLLMLLSPAALASWTLQSFPTFDESTAGLFTSHATLPKGELPLKIYQDRQCWQPTAAARLNQTLSLQPCGDAPPVTWRLFRDGEYQVRVDTRSGTPTLQLSLKTAPQAAAAAVTRTCQRWDGKPVTLDVAATFTEGETVRDFYSGQTARVSQGKVTLQPAAGSGGMLLLESAGTEKPAPFNWHNATVYFALTDRFENGNPANDHSYGRRSDGMQEIGTFHGGDLAGLTQKLDYLQQLGVNALWISSPLEQIHGWVGGGTKGDFPHYAYHGYYALDWTRLDANMGTEQDLRKLVEQAHQRGIRILFDVVVNHVGYATLADMQTFHFGSLYLKGAEIEKTLGKNWGDWRPGPGQNWHSFNDYINFSDKAGWSPWWGKNWIRTDIGDYDSPGYNDLTMSLAFLPDIKTEAPGASGLPLFYRHKPDTAAQDIPGATTRDYLTTWLSQWVRDYGIDGFRVDTAKHVEKPTLALLKQRATAALAQWKAANPHQALDDAPFWMTGEAWGHGVMKSDYYQNGFDAMINFDFQDQASQALSCFSSIDATYQQMADKLQDFNVLSYLSSHDTRLFFASDAKGSLPLQQRAADLLLLAPGAVQIYYGDESGRQLGPTGSDPLQGTRSDMNWREQQGAKAPLLAHWQRLGQFRARHPAIGAGVQQSQQTAGYYAFSRRLGDDKVMVVWVGDRSH
ncbi:alpha-amylase [Serratia plymuthica]|uniref:Alpha-amylase n=1 Tax=Serratia plymuthica TaxID=82996 RepID=A0A2X4U3Y3_SERPL|nr:alpha-amylase [Serratia plymuthica]QPS23095.1 alpha-amylase [Serratia plymuthica]QPS64703.1 alpha-amylase [Serratia plymuthica]RKS62858.1 alpha-amylase [Serratia plymuthica]CAI2492192.1 Alpha-amylase precursor [Serratia plymuthica]SQI29012.1 Alpha-amylase precursor [Serratia plymuthica]